MDNVMRMTMFLNNIQCTGKAAGKILDAIKGSRISRYPPR
jgi:hypothetical protein